MIEMLDLVNLRYYTYYCLTVSATINVLTLIRPIQQGWCP